MATSLAPIGAGMPQQGGNMLRFPGMGGASNGQPVNTNIPTTVGGIMNPSQVVQNNPYASPGVTGTIPTVSTGLSGADGDNTLGGDFRATYGAGTGGALAGVVSTLGTSTNNAVMATVDQTNRAANKQFANIQANEAAAGITPDSSTAALAGGDFWGDVNTSLQSTISGMENSQMSELLQILMGEGKAHGPDESGWDSFMNIVGDVGQIAGPVAAAFGL